jgi:glutaredoxin
MRKLTLFAKPGCCLCEQAKQALVERVEDGGFELEQVDVSLDPVLNRIYGERIPVVELDGHELCELCVDRASLEARLDRVQA